MELTKENAVIGWVIRGYEGRSISRIRFNYDYVPVCTVRYNPAKKSEYGQVDKPLGLWGI